MNKPTIAELEAIMEEKDVEINIRPNGEVFVVKKQDRLIAEIAELEAQLAAAEAEAQRYKEALEDIQDESNWIFVGDPPVQTELWNVIGGDVRQYARDA